LNSEYFGNFKCTTLFEDKTDFSLFTTAFKNYKCVLPYDGKNTPIEMINPILDGIP
jgi:hypothetical protein